MKINTTKVLILMFVLTAALAETGCKKGFLDVNEDPNRPTDDKITADLMFGAAAHSSGALYGGRRMEFLNNWMGYWAVTGQWQINNEETGYDLSFGFGNGLWVDYYNVLYDLYLIKQKALATGDSSLAGSAMILSAQKFQELTDVFGNIPYSQAFNSKLYPTPKYDKATGVYDSLQKSLDLSIRLLEEKVVKSSFPVTDIINKGDKSKWIKFANTLKLRLLIRQSEVSGFDPSVEIAKIINKGGVLHGTETVNVNPGYLNDVNKQSPFYAAWGLSPTGTEANNRECANNYFLALLRRTNDPRISRYFKVPPAGGNITGATYGLANGNPDTRLCSGIGAGLARSASQDQWLLTSVESLFLEAEAIARGWLPGDAQVAYENAVKESFIWLGVPDAVTEATNYMANNDIADWSNAGSTSLSKAKFICYQKYIALAGIDPLEAWSDLRRVKMIPDNGYISVNPAKAKDFLPFRLPYPQSEYTANAQNVLAEGTINIFSSKLFWQQ